MSEQTAVSAASQKYKRGEHPNSKGNLRPWTTETQPAYPGVHGPLITPRIQYLLTLDADAFAAWRPKTVADGIAWRYVAEALAGGLLSEKGRQEVIERVDGKVPDKLIIAEEPKAVGAIKELQDELGRRRANGTR